MAPGSCEFVKRSDIVEGRLSDASDLAKEEEYTSEHAADICPRMKPYPRQQERFPAADKPQREEERVLTTGRVGHSSTSKQTVVQVPRKDTRHAEPGGDRHDEEEEERLTRERGGEERDGPVGGAGRSVSGVIRVLAIHKVVEEERNGRRGDPLIERTNSAARADRGSLDRTSAYGKEVQGQEPRVAEDRDDSRRHEAKKR